MSEVRARCATFPQHGERNMGGQRGRPDSSPRATQTSPIDVRPLFIDKPVRGKGHPDLGRLRQAQKKTESGRRRPASSSSPLHRTKYARHRE
jgi:hypothetical protein